MRLGRYLGRDHSCMPNATLGATTDPTTTWTASTGTKNAQDLYYEHQLHQSYYAKPRSAIALQLIRQITGATKQNDRSPLALDIPKPPYMDTPLSHSHAVTLKNGAYFLTPESQRQLLESRNFLPKKIMKGYYPLWIFIWSLRPNRGKNQSTREPRPKPGRHIQQQVDHHAGLKKHLTKPVSEKTLLCSAQSNL